LSKQSVTDFGSSRKEKSSLVTLQTTFEAFFILNSFFPLDFLEEKIISRQRK
jgi:hypothetical protein